MSAAPTSDRGVALIFVLMVMMTLSALAMSLSVIVSTETRVTANYRDGMAALYGADAVLQRVLSDVAAESDINRILTGLAVSSFVDGPPGSRQLPDGALVDLHTLTSLANCGNATCGEPELNEVSDERPFGVNNPRWRLYGHGSLPGEPHVYGVVWIGDDPAETDGDPFTDASSADEPGRGRLSMMAHGYGPAGTRRVIEATVVKGDRGLRVLSWREIR